jgi:DNA-binding NtrC family response regulator
MAEGAHILLVEDHEESRLSLAEALERQGHVVHQAPTGKSALAIARREALHAVVLDLRLPDMDGLAVLAGLLDQTLRLPIVVVTAFASVDLAVAAMKRGAVDFLTKPLHLGDLTRVLGRAITRARETGVAPAAAAPLIAEMESFGILGGSAPMRELFDQVKRIAPHYTNVLIVGESGTGKELVARALHALGPGTARPFVAVNCATLSESLLESEIFGHEKGAFTSADAIKTGMMEAAHTGTLFLDEVNEMGLACQAKLLRAVERREFRRVGGTRKIKVELRVVGASNANLEEWVTSKRFRADLYYRLKVITIVVPPLRDRREAIPTLTQRFLDDIAGRASLPAKQLTPAALQQLVRYQWPGNVRELRNTIESLTLMSSGPLLDVEDLPPNVRGAKTAAVTIPIGTTLAEAERRLIQRTLEAQGSVKETARVLGIGLRTLHTRLRHYGIRRA